MKKLTDDIEDFLEMTVLDCKECGGKPCICEAETCLWAAHCMTCGNCIGRRNSYDPCAISKEDAIRRWNKLNEN